MEPISVFVTTFNNADTLPACLASVAWADEVLVLDSFSTDATTDIARAHGCVVHQHEFLGYGRQKEMAMELTAHEWVLLLDADEMLSPALQKEVQDLKEAGFSADGYTIARNEQLFWKMSDAATRKNYYLRLFAKSKTHFSEMPVHAAPKVSGSTVRLKHQFYHFGERDIHTKVDKINGYSTGVVSDKVKKGRRPSPWIMFFYPPFYFIRSFFFKRGFLNGWAGFIASATVSFYVFLKYAKLYEHYQFERHGDRYMPMGAPELRTPSELHDRPV